MSLKKQVFLITVTVLEGRHFVRPNMDSAVIVRIDSLLKSTSVKKNTDAPYYNEYFVFEFYETLENVLEKNITVTVVEPSNMWRKRKVLGYITLDVATVWQQKNHQFYHKWAILSTIKTEVYSGPQGYLKLDISVLTKGEVPRTPVNVINDEIEGNLLLPEGKFTERQKAKYIFDIYYCKDLVSKPSVYEEDTNDEENSKITGPTTFVEISFAGVSVRTSTKKSTSFPEFNEKLTIIDLFPPLCQTIKIEVCYGDVLRKTVHSQKQITLKQISNDKDEGFLPTLGPTFLHLYSKRALEGYAGSILMAINTVVDDSIFSNTKRGTLVESILPIIEKDYFESEGITLFAIIYELTAINKQFCKKPISVKMTFGNMLLQKKTFDGLEARAINSTSDIIPIKITKNYYYLNFFDEKPCLWILCEVPYFKKIIYNSNILTKIAQRLKTKLQAIETLFENENPKEASPLIAKNLLEVTDFILTAGKRYIDIITSYKLEHKTKLDIEKRKICLQEMADIVKKTKNLDRKYSNKKCFGKLQKMYVRIKILIDDVEDCWPDIILWLVHGKKHVASIQISARDLIFSNIDEEKGQYCGVKQTLCFNDHVLDKRNLAAKMEIMMHLALDRHKSTCQLEIPPDVNYENVESVPRCLVSKTKKVFELRCYIFQGKLISGFDRSGLADPFVRIIVQDQLKETKVISNCLNPIWDQTLVFSNLVIDEFYIPSVLMEVYDKDEPCTSEIVGRTIVYPKISFIESQRESLKLEWYKAYSNEEVAGEVLATFEYSEIREGEENLKRLELPKSGKIFHVPIEIKPALVAHKIEVLFWGMRHLGKVNLISIKRPRITVLCGDNFFHSDTIENAHKNPNFTNQTKSLLLIFPVQKEYAPPLRFKMYDSRRFGVYTYSGVHITQVSPFLITPMSVEERKKRLSEVSINNSSDTCESSIISIEKVEALHVNIPLDTETEEASEEKCRGGFLYKACWCCCKPLDKPEERIRDAKSSTTTYEPLTLGAGEDYDEEDYDWWTKFYASVENTQNMDVPPQKRIRKIKIYENELESQPEFKGFSDMLTSFEIFKGKRTGDSMIDEGHVTGIFKGSVKIYEYPLESSHKYIFQNGDPLEGGVFQNYPINDPVWYVLRVYVIRAIGLRPKDLNGLSDPYLVLKLNDKVVMDKENYVPKNVNPVFGKYFEFGATFPQDYLLKISLWDYDISTIDDLIGETEIDLENRFYSKHMACCGISETYEESGYCAWRGQFKPSAILAELCKKFNIEGPEYTLLSVKVGCKEFMAQDFISSGNRNKDIEVLALTALRRWKEMPVVGFSLVPEHVETRSLFHPTKPGIEQGKLQLWIDIFPVCDLPAPPNVDIKVRKPVPYELRVIIWNTDEVTLSEDDYYTGSRKSDIFVKGWVTDSSEAQYTDVHYRSLTGEGNFNWRFVFNFDYLRTENKIVLKRKDKIFALDKTEYKLPCKLTLQIWDNDTFTTDDFIGTLSLELSRLHRPSQTPNKCSLKILNKGAPTINLFKIRRTKGWWPLRGVDKKTNVEICTGKVEAEMELLALEEAQKEPAGLGRHEPQPLQAPNRPDTSFSWFTNPMKALNFVLCKIYKWRLILICIAILGILMAISFFYALPSNAVKVLLHTARM